jgi:hypothetical protein
MFKQILKKLVLYSIIYVIVCLIISPNELFCSFQLNEMCIASISVKWLFFILIMFIYDKFIKPLFQNKTK